MKESVIWLSLQSKAQTDKRKAACMKLWTQLLVGTKICRKNVRVSHDTTLTLYDDFLQNRVILPLLMMLTKLLIKSIMAIHKWWLKLLVLFNSITIPGHACVILSSQSSQKFQHQPGSGSDHHTGNRKHVNFQTVFWSVPSWIQWTLFGKIPQCHSFMDV